MSSGCGDCLSLEDLKTAKKHQTFEAEVITGHAGGVTTGANIDFAYNAVTLQMQKTLPAILRDFGFNPAEFDFVSGGTLSDNDRDKAVYNPADNNWYSWGGPLPKIVAAGEDPTADANWIPRTDQLLRDQLNSADLALGGGIVNTPYNLNVNEMLALGRVVYPEMYHNGIENPTDDQLWTNMFAALTALPDTALSNDLPYIIDMRGKVYTILETHQIDINLGIINGYVHFNGGRFILGDYASTGKTRRYFIDFRWDYIGTSYFPYALS